ncbi:Caprin homolog [Eumeta japonica]|uniref:Caprin homolog n=1 Tax=Eumeta variegata TaxID=151549 RepID=A0A4C1VKJ0_EUMVA|nr:Caprin homolog [Eumeta japonica]
MPSASNGKSEKPAPSEGADSSALRQIMILVEHKIRNLEKRKSKLTSYRDLQKSGKDLNSDQKIAVAKYDEVAQTLEFTRELFKQITAIVTAADREAKKQAKKEAWVRIAAETSKMRDLLIIIDCLTQMGSPEAREDFLKGANGAVKLTEEDLKILDDIYPEVTPKHEVDEEGRPSFHAQTIKAADHLYAIIDGKPKEVLGTTYTHVKDIIMSIHDCGYFDKAVQNDEVTVEVNQVVSPGVETVEPVEEMIAPELVFAAGALPVPPAAAVVPAPAYPLRPLPPITLQEVEHAYFAQQYPQQARPIAEVIGSQNFVFIQDSEIDSPVGTPQPPPILNQPSPPAPIPTQTFTNQHYVPMPGTRVAPEPASLPIPQPHFAPPPEHPAYAGAPLAHTAPVPQPPPPAHHVPLPPHPHPTHIVQPAHLSPQDQNIISVPPPAPQLYVDPDESVQTSTPAATTTVPTLASAPTTAVATTPADDDDDWHEEQSPERDDTTERRTQGQGDGYNRYRRYGRGGRGAPNGYRGRGGYQRSSNDGYHNRQNDYQTRQNKEGYQNRQNNDGFSSRHKDNYHQNRGSDNYYGNGDSGNGGHHDDNGASRGRERYDNQNYQGGYKSRGRGGPRGTSRGAPRASRPPPHQYGRKGDNAD